MSETTNPSVEKLDLGPFKGSDRPDKISVFSDKSSQVVWKKPGSNIRFDEYELLGSPMVHDLHRALGFRLLQPDGSTQVMIFTDSAVVARQYSQDGKITGEKAYTRSGIDRNYDAPGAAVIGQPLSLLSGAYSGQLAVVNEITRPPYHDDPHVSGRDMAEHLLHGCHGMYGGEYDDIPGADMGRPNTLLVSLGVAEQRIQTAIDRVGIIAVQNLGVVTR